ncbi:STAS-like domain-containing protein [Rhizobium miluonense]|uniref:STAS-like domain-containing protein n=1 Tax=Rhizobium miluonense TaxID=411945 RepID=UPI00386209E6
MIDVAQQFWPYPSGRVSDDGSYNGLRFRTEFLEPALENVRVSPTREKVVVNIDGVRSFGSSFLEEAFGGLVRSGRYTKRDLDLLLEVQVTKPHLFIYRDAIQKYIADARADALATHN